MNMIKKRCTENLKIYQNSDTKIHFFFIIRTFPLQTKVLRQLINSSYHWTLRKSLDTSTDINCIKKINQPADIINRLIDFLLSEFIFRYS